MRLLPVFLRSVLLWGLATGAVFGQEPVGAEVPVLAEEPLTTPPAVGADAWAEIIRAAVISALPEQQVHEKNWGHTKGVLYAYKIRTRKGWFTMRPKTHQVNHGFWQRQTVTMLQPEETLKIHFANVQRLPAGKLIFTMQIEMRARIRTAFAHWVYGVKGLNGGVEADVTLNAIAHCSLDLTSVQHKGELLPTIQLVPEVADIKLRASDIDARKIGLIGGWAAEEIGDYSRSTVNLILRESRGSILRSLQRKITKNQDRLKISPSQLLGGSKPPAVSPAKR